MLQHLPLVLADALGYFRAEGVQVMLQEHAADTEALAAVYQGQADLCSAPFEALLRQQARGRALRAFVLQTRSPQVALAVAVRQFPSYRDLVDLKGRRIGVPALDSGAQWLAAMLIARVGLAERDVQFVPVGSGADALQAFRSGRVHALCHGEPVMSQLEARNDARVVADLRGLKAMGDLLGSALPDACLMAPPAFLQRQPAVAQSITHAMVHALKWLQTAAPADLVRVLPAAYLLGDRSSYLAALGRVRDTFSPNGLLPEDGPQAALKLLQRVQPAAWTDTRVDLSRTYTNEWVRKARQKFNA
ncbi:ABC transporter substrate-binding protein [Acidovorax lacteus]|uniref:ABC transporter substrate-binding protein n=1 Tax=Acidovorax lacteus TaxID=1924988 RepID=A0ABP8L2R2_9BURK